MIILIETRKGKIEHVSYSPSDDYYHVHVLIDNKDNKRGPIFLGTEEYNPLRCAMAFTKAMG